MGVVVAIDPGYDRVGIAVLNGMEVIHSECFSPKKGELPERLLAVFSHVQSVIKKYKPDAVALETLFFSNNQKTAIAVAEARGVIMVAAMSCEVPVFEYSPQAVKIAVTGSGNAQKAAVIKMVERTVKLSVKKRVDDEFDAIALGIAHQAQSPLLRGLK